MPCVSSRSPARHRTKWLVPARFVLAKIGGRTLIPDFEYCGSSGRSREAMRSHERRPAPLPTGRPSRDMFVSPTEHPGDKPNLTEIQAKRLACRFKFPPPTRASSRVSHLGRREYQRFSSPITPSSGTRTGGSQGLAGGRPSSPDASGADWFRQDPNRGAHHPAGARQG